MRNYSKISTQVANAILSITTALAPIATLMVSARASAREIIYKSPDQSAADFLAQRLAQNEAIGFDEYLVDRTVPRTLKDGLTEAYVLAQEAFLKTELNHIEAKWRDVAAFAYKADWGVAQREMIQTALLRLAQIAATADETRAHLLEAVRFAPDYEPDAKLFPPPVVTQFRLLRQRDLRTVVLRPSEWAGFTILLVNGVRHDLGDEQTLQIAPGMKRFTLISPTYETVSRGLDATELEAWRPPKVLHQELLAKVSAQQTPTLRPRDLQNSAGYTEPPSFEQTVASGRSATVEKPFYKKSKFWYITAALAGVALVANATKKDEGRAPPTHHEGL